MSSFRIPLCAFLFLILGTQLQAAQKYRVSSGDTLYRIGLRFGIPYQEIMRANGMKKTVIYPNQVLVIPAKAHVAHTKPRPAQQPVQVATNTYHRPTPTISHAPRNEDPGFGYRPQIRSTKPIARSSRPMEPVQPYVIARKLPTAPKSRAKAPAPYNPPPKYSPPAPPAPPRSIAQSTPIARPVEQHPPHRLPSIKAPSRGREVPAAAHLPGRGYTEPPNQHKSYTKLDPIKFPTPSFKTPTQPRQRTYVVQRGDSVWGISRKHNVSPIKLRMENNIMFSKIRPGMRLMIP